MPDTGAPWNLPYPSPTDLVRDAPQAFEDLAEAVADGLDDAASEGIGPNVVSVIKTDTQATSIASGATTAITGFSATITPSTNTSKILVLVQASVSSAGGNGSNVILERDGNPIAVGDAAGPRIRVTSGQGRGASDTVDNQSIFFLDSPTSNTAVTYSCLLHNAGTVTANVVVNRSTNDSSSSISGRSVSTITLIEVKA
jgi:hypothetical protein